MIFVIVILGILGTLSSEILLRMYQTYVMQKGVQNIEIKLKTVLEQVSKYTENAIKPSVVFYNGINYQDIIYISKTAGELDNNNKLYMWIGKDVESMQGIWDGSRIYPAYSGLADLENSTGTSITTPDCDLRNVDDIVESITGKGDISVFPNRSALYFPNANSTGNAQSRFWDNNPTSLFTITSPYIASNSLTVSPQPREIGDMYYLTYSAYGIRLDNGDLKLLWNFRPWENQNFNNADDVLLAENITKFQVWSESGGSLIRFYICATDPDIALISSNDNWEYCKESAVLR